MDGAEEEEEPRRSHRNKGKAVVGQENDQEGLEGW